MATSKIFQVMGYVPENGLASGTQSEGWGDSVSWKTPGADDLFPYLTFGNKPTIVKVEDNSITADAATAAKTLVGRLIDTPMTYHPRYNGMDFFTYWQMGFVNNSFEVVVFKAGTSPWSVAEATPGTVFLDTTPGTPREFTYLRTFTGKDSYSDAESYYVFAADATPTDTPAGVLTESGDTPTFTYTSHSTVKYERLYELDREGKYYRPYTTAETALDDYSSGDIKVAMMTLAKHFTNTDVRYGNAMCRQWTYNQPAADIARYETNLLAWAEDKGDYSFADWTIPTDLEDNDDVPAAYQTVIQMGPTVASWADACPDSFSLAVETPYQQIQTICSGYHIAKPVLEGHISITLTANIARYEDETYQDWRDGNTRLFARIGMNYGWDSMEFLLKNLILDEAGPDDGDVAAEPIVGMCSKCGTTNDEFVNGNWLEGHTQLQNMPLLLRTINDNANSPMFLY